MFTVVSFKASALPPGQLRQILNDYQAVERARMFRRLLTIRCGALALVVALLGGALHWLPPFATWFGTLLCLVPPAGAWGFEQSRRRRLARQLEQIPAS